MAVDSNLGAAVGVEEGAIGSIPGNEGRIAQVWVNARGCECFTRRYKGKCDIFSGIGHRLTKEEMEGWRFAADATRITNETTGSEDQKHTAGVLWQSTTTWEQFWGVEEGAIGSIPGNEGRIAQVRENVRGGMRMFAAYCWHTEGWSTRNEAMSHKASMADSM